MNPGMQLPPKAGVIDEITEVEAPEVEIAEGDVTIAPEAVSYRDEQQVCGNCRYMQESGECTPLRMVVGPQDGCNLFADRGA